MSWLSWCKCCKVRGGLRILEHLHASSAVYSHTHMRGLGRAWHFNLMSLPWVQMLICSRCMPIAENPARARLFHQQSEQHMASPPDPYTVFIRYGFAWLCATNALSAPRLVVGCCCACLQAPEVYARILQVALAP